MKTLETWKTVSAIALFLSIAVAIISLIGLVWSDDIIWGKIGITSLILFFASLASIWLSAKVEEQLKKRNQ